MEIDAGDLDGIALACGGAVKPQRVAQFFHVERSPGRDFVALLAAGEGLNDVREFAVDEADEQKARLRLQLFSGVIGRLLRRCLQGVGWRRGSFYVRTRQRWGSAGACVGGQRAQTGHTWNVPA